MNTEKWKPYRSIMFKKPFVWMGVLLLFVSLSFIYTRPGKQSDRNFGTGD